MNSALDPDPESDFQIFGDSVSGLGSSKKRNCNTYSGVMIPARDPDSELDFQPFGDSRSGF